MTESNNPRPGEEEWGGQQGDSEWERPAGSPPPPPPGAGGYPPQQPGGYPPPTQPGGYGQQPPYGGQPGYGGYGGPPPKIPNYLPHSIVATILCCLPAGIVAIIYASQVNGKLAAGDIAGAQKASQNARMWTIISVVAGLVALIVWFFVLASSDTTTV